MLLFHNGTVQEIIKLSRLNKTWMGISKIGKKRGGDKKSRDVNTWIINQDNSAPNDKNINLHSAHAHKSTNTHSHTHLHPHKLLHMHKTRLSCLLNSYLLKVGQDKMKIQKLYKRDRQAKRQIHEGGKGDSLGRGKKWGGLFDMKTFHKLKRLQREVTQYRFWMKLIGYFCTFLHRFPSQVLWRDTPKIPKLKSTAH